MNSLGSLGSSLNIYFWITLGLLTINAVLYTHSVMKAKDKSYKYEVVGAVVSYLIFAVLLFKVGS